MTQRSSLMAPLALAMLAGWMAASSARAETGSEDEPLPPAFLPPGDAAPPAATGAPLPEAGRPERLAPPVVPDAYLPSLTGPIGLYHLSTSEVGPVDHLRLALHGQFFHASSFLIEGDEDTRLAGELSFGFTPHPSFELFGALLNSSNRNTRAAEANRRDPELIKSFGDLILGGKGIYRLGPGLTIGGEVGFRLLSAISDLAISPSSTSFWIGPIATLDLRSLSGVPMRFHLNVNYYADNSGNLYDFSGTTTHTEEVALFAYGIEDSRFRFALGVDAPLEDLTIPLQLFAEYHLEVVTASGDPAFAIYASPENRDQQWMTVGARARIFHGLTLDAGLDIGLRSVGYEYGPPLPPYDLIFGVGFPFDIDSFRRPVVVAPVAPSGPPTGTVTGSVKAADGKAIGGAVVTFAGRARSRVATDPDGSFASGPLAPGPVDLEIAADGFEAAKATATVSPDAPASVNVQMTAKVSTGAVRGKVVGADGQPLTATLRFIGGTTYEAHTDTSGAFSAALPAGPYRVTVDAPGFPTHEQPLDLAAGQDLRLDIVIRAPNPDVTLTSDAILLRVPIRFAPGNPKLAPLFKQELNGVADILADHPELRKLRIETHWSGPKGNAGAAVQALTARQAAVVRDYLVGKGVAAERLEAAGRGGEVPLVPNLGPANQKKNRRVDLIVVQ